MVDLNSQDLWSDSSNQMTSMAGPGFKEEEDHLNIKTVTGLVFITAAHKQTVVVMRSRALLIHPSHAQGGGFQSWLRHLFS